MTRLRRSVLASVLTSDRPLTAYQILDRLRIEDASTAPMVVYRSLNVLIRLGLVHRVDSTKSFVACTMHEHAHPCQILVCHSCGATVEAWDESIAGAAERLGRRFGFALDRNVIELTGICGSCQQEAS
ncbi:MAG TPA: Fur family transcriptional regulator [Magnetospirillaceae bacterium]